MADATMHPPLPTSEDAFAQDDRISFSRLDNKYIAVNDEDGTELEFDQATRKWVLPPDHDDDNERELQQQDAHLAELAQSGSTTTAQDVSASRKRKDAPRNGNEDPDDSAPDSGSQTPAEAAPAKRPRPAKKPKAPPAPRQNTAVYVTGLPRDATADEVHELFSRKAGVVAEEIDSGRPRIKMYTDEQGGFKGDALVVFFKPQSVDMAIMLLDDTDLRVEPSGRGSGRMRVQAADASYKKTTYDDNGAAAAAAADAKGKAPEGAAPLPPKHQQQSRADRDRDRQKIIKKTQKLDAKLADWSDDDTAALPTAAASKWDRLVVLRHMFTLAELEEDPAALLEIKEDVREECAKLGAVTNVVLFDEEPDGVVSVKFRDPLAAQACIAMMHGRSFDGRVVEASLATGREKFRRSKGGQADEEDE
ncbi:Splicing factor U2AF-associated protein 2 like [Verticillium longisporum]|uniref:Splicing factor U2AF-associated protein 2 like n=1 Tax=Verticillium longisporum TaxID=100787 RepID=A0A8I3ARR8_VERLO|nr:Splicing factor U2AF-associated protein 2 like [Verticillium longisporum]